MGAGLPSWWGTPERLTAGFAVGVAVKVEAHGAGQWGIGFVPLGADQPGPDPFPLNVDSPTVGEVIEDRAGHSQRGDSVRVDPLNLDDYDQPMLHPAHATHREVM